MINYMCSLMHGEASWPGKVLKRGGKKEYKLLKIGSSRMGVIGRVMEAERVFGLGLRAAGK